jgi:hypothetical protein
LTPSACVNVEPNGSMVVIVPPASRKPNEVVRPASGW